MGDAYTIPAASWVGASAPRRMRGSSSMPSNRQSMNAARPKAWDWFITATAAANKHIRHLGDDAFVQGDLAPDLLFRYRLRPFERGFHGPLVIEPTPQSGVCLTTEQSTLLNELRDGAHRAAVVGLGVLAARGALRWLTTKRRSTMLRDVEEAFVTMTAPAWTGVDVWSQSKGEKLVGIRGWYGSGRTDVDGNHGAVIFCSASGGLAWFRPGSWAAADDHGDL